MKNQFLSLFEKRVRPARPAVVRGVVALVAGVTLALGSGTPVRAADGDAEEKPKGWEMSANAGLTLARGNTENFLATAGFDGVRKWKRDEILLGASAGYGESTDSDTDVESTTAAYVKGFGQYNHLFTERVYGGLRVDGMNDSIADVHYRFSISPLAGYYFIKKPMTTLSADAGPSWVIEKVGSEGPRGYLGLRVGERFEQKFKNGARIWQTAEITPEIDDWQNFVLNAELGVEAPITKKLSARLALQGTHDNEPASGRKKLDVKLIAGLAYKF